MITQYSEKKLGSYEVDITNINNIEEIKNIVSNMIDNVSWTLPKYYILESISTNLDNYIKNKDDIKEIVVKSKAFEKIKTKAKIKQQSIQLSIFD